MTEERPAKKKRQWRSKRLPKPFTVRADETEHDEIVRRAALARKSASRYLVESGLRGRPPAMRDRMPPSGDELELLERLLFEVRKAGTNLNRIAYVLNTAAQTGAPGPLVEDVAAAARAAAEALEAVRGRMR